MHALQPPSCGCQPWLLALRKIYRLGIGGMFGNKAPKKLFGLKVTDVAKELRCMHTSPHMVKVIKWRTMRWADYMQSLREINPYNNL
jgi:hypothetical protein